MAHRLAGRFAGVVAAVLLALGFVVPRSALGLTCTTDTTTADFATVPFGTCYAGERAGGEVLLSPTEGTEFFGTALPSGWLLRDWHSPNGVNTSSVGGGVLSANDVRVNPDPAPYGAPRSLEFVATFRAETNQHVGFGGGDQTGMNEVLNGPPWAMFSTCNAGACGVGPVRLWARTHNGTTFADTVVTTPVDGLSHKYRIDWGTSAVAFYIDDSPVHTDAIAISANMRPVISDFANAADLLTVDWLRMTPYGSPCTYESNIIDGGNAAADWSALNASTLLPGGTGIAVTTRSGNTPTPDGTWSLPQALSGNTIQSPTARYLQYQAELSTGDVDETPELEAVQVCYDECTPTGSEICDGVDNDCDGQTDEGTGGGMCNTGVPGLCAAGTYVCNAGMLQCPQTIFPVTETCNNFDDDCDGLTDEGTGGAMCNTGVPGLCAAGTYVCNAGMLQCPQTIFPVTEICNNFDDDCNGLTDEGTSGGMCNTGLLGVCANGTNQCQSGSLVCVQNTMSGPEVCNSLDDDCDGTVNDGDPGGGGSCTTGQPGICSPGTLHCVGNSVVCQANQVAGMEVCNNLDDNCNGDTDEGTSGAGCMTGQPGVCGPGTLQCQSGSLNCVQTTPSSTELCQTGQDENCNGQTDEAGCACAMVDTVSSGTQTKLSKVRLDDDPGSDKVLSKGTFTLPVAGAIDPATQVVRIRITDNQGLSYEGSIPATNFVASPSGRTFKFSDQALAHDGIKKAKFSIRGDGVTVKYLFKAQNRDLPAFIPGTGTATVIIGTKCFKDSGDTCALSPSGKTAKCQ